MRARDRLWQEAAAELTPAKSLARVDAKANLLLTMVGLLATVVTGLGLAAANLLTLPAPARALAVVAVAAAVMGAAIALGSLVLRVTPALAPNNLAAVEAWYRRQFRLARWVAAAGWLVVVALVLAGSAGAVTVLTGKAAPSPRLTLRAEYTGAQITVTVEVALSGADTGTVVTAELDGLSTDALPAASRRAVRSGAVLGRAVAAAGPDGTAMVTLTGRGLSGYRTVQAVATAAGHTCTAAVPLTTVIGSSSEPRGIQTCTP